MKRRKLERLAAGIFAGLTAFALTAQTALGAPEKLLYIERVGRKLCYTYQAGGGNQFMSFRSMIPGVTYHDEMDIENQTSREYDIYMQAVPREQSAILDELLKTISMQVYYNGKLLYDGTAMGGIYPGETPEGSLQTMVPLGRYGAGETGNISVNAGLPGSMTIEENERFNGQLAKIDWKFLIGEVPDSGGGDPGDGGGGDSGGGDPPGRYVPEITTVVTGDIPLAGAPVLEIPQPPVPLAQLNPKTGDELPVDMLEIVVVLSGCAMILGGIYLVRQRKKEKEQG